jgi:hypothetical protein
MTYVTTNEYPNSVSETVRTELASKTAGIGANLSAHLNDFSSTFKKNVLCTFSGISKAAGVFAVEISKTITPNLSVAKVAAGANSLQEFSYRRNNTEQKSEISKELFLYKFLEPGWDGPNSVRPSTSAIVDASEFIWRLPIDVNLPEPTVYADGQVGWYWRNDDDVLSVVFSGDSKYAYYGSVKGHVARSPTRQYSTGVPVDLYQAIRNI